MIDDLKDKVTGLHIQTAKDGTIKLNHQCHLVLGQETSPWPRRWTRCSARIDWGYIVISQKGNAYDGSILIRGGKERGYPADKDK